LSANCRVPVVFANAVQSLISMLFDLLTFSILFNTNLG
jgi:hypothetical protein